jgi:hypothetical protein
MEDVLAASLLAITTERSVLRTTRRRRQLLKLEDITASYFAGEKTERSHAASLIFLPD